MHTLYLFLSLIAFTIFGLVVLFLTYFVAMPLKRMSAYKAEGRPTYFFPVIGCWKFRVNLKPGQNDILADLKEFGLNTPEKKVLISNLRSVAVVFLRDSELIKEHLQKQQYYVKANHSMILFPLGGTGLFLAEGETWKRHRKIISNSFHYEFLKNNVANFQKIAKGFFAKVTPEDLKAYSVIPRIQDITGEVLGQVFFGENLTRYTFDGKPLTTGLADLVSDLALCGRSSVVLLFGPKVMRLPIFPKFVKILERIATFRRVCGRIITDRKANPIKTHDLLGSLLATQQSEDPNQVFSDEDIINEFVIFFAAGMDTTGHMIGMTLYNLATYPQYLKQLKEERDATYNQEEVVTADTLQKMNVLHAVMKETLRFYTPALGPVFRTAIQDHQIGDITIRKGDQVRAELFPQFFDHKHFESPEEFKPERWLNPTSTLSPHVFIPFSAGPRNCIGQHMAIFEGKVILSEFLDKFEFKLPEGYKLRMSYRFLYEPLEDMKLELTPINA